jgi:serine/threonine-protein kinase
LYECATGRRPFFGATDAERKHNVLVATPPRPSALVPSLPAAFDDIVSRVLCKDAPQRYPDVRALGAALLTFADEATCRAWKGELLGASLDAGRTSIEGDTPPHARTIAAPPRRNRAAWVVLGGALLLVATSARIAAEGRPPERADVKARAADTGAPVRADVVAPSSTDAEATRGLASHTAAPSPAPTHAAAPSAAPSVEVPSAAPTHTAAPTQSAAPTHVAAPSAAPTHVASSSSADAPASPPAAPWRNGVLGTNDAPIVE